MNYPSTRKEAKATGAKYYFTGKPCKHGHIAPRKTKGVCTECMKVEWARSNAVRSEAPKTEASKAAGRRYYQRNIELTKERARNRTSEDQRKYKQTHKDKNSEYYKTLVNARRRRLKECQPPWITEQQKRDIRQVYADALRLKELTGEEYEVDHIIPINGENVSGLHVPWNLQVLHQTENLKKSNNVDT